MTNRKLLTTFLFLITDPIHSFYAQSFLFLNYPLRLHPVPRWAPMWSTKCLGDWGLMGNPNIFALTSSPTLDSRQCDQLYCWGVWDLYVSLSLYSLFQSHSDSYLCGPTDLDAGGGGLHALPVHYSWSLPGLCPLGTTGGGCVAPL